MRCVLNVKSTTSNIIVVGESGQIPPSISAHIKAICYLNRLQNLAPYKIVNQTYWELLKLLDYGFNTWVTKVLALAQKYDIDLNMNHGAKFKQYCKNRIINQFKNFWLTELQNIERNPILRNYNTFKLEFGMEKYRDMVTDKRYRTAITRLRTSTHTLEMELGRYTIPRTSVTNRLCCVCKVVGNEENFLVSCEQYADLRDDKKVAHRFNGFTTLSDHEKYIFLVKTGDPYILAWLGKQIAQSFVKRCETQHNITWSIEWCF